MKSWKKYGLASGAMLALAMGILLVTGWGTAVAAQVTNVFVTNDAAHAVPIHEQGTATVNVANSSLAVHELGTANVSVTGGSVRLEGLGTASRTIGHTCIGPANTICTNNSFTTIQASTIVLSDQDGEITFAFNAGGNTKLLVGLKPGEVTSIPLIETLAIDEARTDCAAGSACHGDFTIIGN